MRVKIVCSECSEGGEAKFFLDTFHDDGLYKGRCAAGHEMLVATQTLRHEMLFEIALNAIEDAYMREAVTSFNASMERFFEFSIRVIARSKAVKDDSLNAAWKTMKNASERQIGAYILLHTTEFGIPPELIPDTMVNLRNKVVHQGYLPTREEAIKFGAAAYKVIQSGIMWLEKRVGAHVREELHAHVSKISEKMGNRYPRTFQVTPTSLNIIGDPAIQSRNFEELLASRGLGVSK